MGDPIQALAGRFETAPYSRRLGVRVEALALDRAAIRIPYKHENANPGRALHGGVAASAIDVAGTLAAWSGLPAEAAFEAGTLDLTVNYLAAAIGEDIVAEAAVLRRGKEIVVSDVAVRNDAGKAIARGLVTYRAFERARLAPGGDRRRRTRPEAPAEAPDDVPPLARAFVSVPFMASLGLDVTALQDGRAVVRMPWSEEKTADGEAVHEGALAALIDSTGALASWSVTGIDLRYKASTVGLHASYHAPVAREDVVAEGRTWSRNNEIFLNQVSVTGAASGAVVATGSVTYRIVVP
jgi:uncharacterized protein (TIGR00369 family)